ncbi:hypothetical protein [Mycobacterium sp. SMC-11]|uniref:hypothetical protein n=1 Tax=Mycobacterium sp. SMC-11 TaxID=3385969 RepID=UPI00390C4828
MTIFASDGTTQDIDPAAQDAAPATLTPTHPAPESEARLEVIEPELIGPDPENDGTTAGQTLPAVRETSDASATTDATWTHPAGWQYDWLEFKGDKLAIRIPKGAALVALEFARYRSEEAQEQAFGRFIARHVSDETFDRVLDRMSNPDDEEYGTTSLGELAGLLGKIAGERIAKDAKALDEAKQGKARKGNS